MEHKTEQQNNYGWNLTWDATGKFPIIAKRIWKTLAALLAWVDDPNDTAIEGLIVSVYADTDDNNGIYRIKKIGDGTNAGIVVKQFDQSNADEILDNIDLTNYYTKEEVDQQLNKKQDIIPAFAWDSLPNGVYAVSKEGNPVTFEDADETCIAVALVVNDAPVPLKFMIAKNNAKSDNVEFFAIKSNASRYDYLVDDLKVYGSNSLPEKYKDNYTLWANGAISDFNGKENTAAIYDYTGSYLSSNTLDLYDVIHPFNAGDNIQKYGDNCGYSDWYVPAVGQLGLMQTYLEDLDTALEKIGGVPLNDFYIWSSTNVGSYPYIVSNDYSYIANEEPSFYYGANVRYIRDIQSLTDIINDLQSNKADRSELESLEENIPTKTSQLINDSNFVADNPIDYSQYDNGVYAVTATDTLIDYKTADSSCVGVALIANEYKFMIPKADATNGTNYDLYWGKNLKGRKIDRLTYYTKVDGTNIGGYLTGSSLPQLSTDFTTWTTGALSDFDGKGNTTAIIDSYTLHGVDMDNRDMCKVLETYNEGGFIDWYVPACGQLSLIYLNITEINAALAKIGGTTIKSNYYFSSSQYSFDNAWRVLIYGYIGNESKASTARVRFIRDLSSKSLTGRVKNLESQMGNVNTVLESIING